MLVTQAMWPVPMALDLILLNNLVKHKDRAAVLFPHHQPKMAHCKSQWTLSEDVLTVSLGHLLTKKNLTYSLNFVKILL